MHRTLVTPVLIGKGVNYFTTWVSLSFFLWFFLQISIKDSFCFILCEFFSYFQNSVGFYQFNSAKDNCSFPERLREFFLNSGSKGLKHNVDIIICLYLPNICMISKGIEWPWIMMIQDWLRRNNFNQQKKKVQFQWCIVPFERHSVYQISSTTISDRLKTVILSKAVRL